MTDKSAIESKVSDSTTAAPPKVEIDRALSKAIEVLSFVKSRFPVLQALSRELDRMAAGRNVPAVNAMVMQMARDSFDMLVIDLFSLREGMLKSEGLFAIFKAHHRGRRSVCSTASTSRRLDAR